MHEMDLEEKLKSDESYFLPLQKEEHSIPADFGEEDLAFVEELNALFSPEEEELPPYFAQTLLESEDPRFYPVEPDFEKKTSVRVFRDLKLRRPLYHNPRSLLGAVTTGMHGFLATMLWTLFTSIKQRISRGLMDQLWNWCLASLTPGQPQRVRARLSYVNLNRVKRPFKWCKMLRCIPYKTISTVAHRLSM